MQPKKIELCRYRSWLDTTPDITMTRHEDLYLLRITWEGDAIQVYLTEDQVGELHRMVMK